MNTTTFMAIFTFLNSPAGQAVAQAGAAGVTESISGLINLFHHHAAAETAAQAPPPIPASVTINLPGLQVAA